MVMCISRSLRTMRAPGRSRSMGTFRRMPKRRITFRTLSRATANTARKSSLLALILCALSIAHVPAQTSAPSLSQVATLRKTALATLGVREPKTVEISGAMQTAHIEGTFHIWRQGDNERFDENLGIRRETTLRVGEREFIRNATGQVRQLRGILVQ